MDDGVTNTRPPFVDAHFHLWDHAVLRYPWLDAPETAPIAATIASPIIGRSWRQESGGRGACRCGRASRPGADETIWLNEVADEDGLPSGIVARVELDHPAAEAQLAWQAAQPRVKGIRHLINWHRPMRAPRLSQDLTRDPRWRAGYALLGRFGLSYDFHGFPAQLSGLAEVAAQHPEVPVILNHLALPIPADGLEEWRAGLIAFAAMPHAAIKLSGAGFVGPRFDPAAFADIVAEVIDRFGTDRVMIATNFPTDRLAADLDRTLGAYEALLTGFSDDERRDLWGRNANRIYRLGLNL